nr:E3 ubiquitin-protein ligase At4g11680-like [Ipomoea batatas]
MAWERTKNLVRAFVDVGDNIIFLTMSRFLRDFQEHRRPAAAVTVAFRFLDVAVAAIFAVVAFTVLVTSRRETPRMPFRLWIFVFALQCLAHLAWLYVKHYPHLQQQFRVVNLIKHVEYGKDSAYFTWWFLGLSWLVNSNGYDELAPQLTSLTAIFLFFDFAIFLVVVLGFIITTTILICLLPAIYIAFRFSRDQGQGIRVQNIQLPPCPFCDYPLHKTCYRLI